MVNAYGARAGLHDLLQKSYAKYLRRAAATAVFLHVAVFVFAPPVNIVPYQLASENMQVVLIEPSDPVVLPDPPADVKHPPPGPPDRKDPVLGWPDNHDPLPEPPEPPRPDTWAHSLVPAPPPYTPHYDQAPEPIDLARPDYPQLAREAGLEGTVQVLARIGTDGSVLAAEVYRSDVTPAMARSAVEAVRRSRFKPARQGPRAVAATVVVPVRFSLGR